MTRKGQITLYVIIGIVVLVIIGMGIFIVNKYTNLQLGKEISKVFTGKETASVEKQIQDCLEKYGDEAITLIGNQGGDINPTLYKLYNGHKVSYLCYTENFTSCINRRPMLKSHIENEINSYVASRLKSCIKLDSYAKQGYEIKQSKPGVYNVKTELNDYSTIISLDLPMKITKAGMTQEFSVFTKTFDIPLGKITDVTNDIVSAETTNGEFFYDVYMLAHKGQIEIERHKPEDAKIYIVNLRNNPYKFTFAIQNYVS